MPPEKGEGGEMGICAFLASPNFWGLEVLIVPGSPPEAWPGLRGGDRWRKAGKVSLLAFLSQLPGERARGHAGAVASGTPSYLREGSVNSTLKILVSELRGAAQGQDCSCHMVPGLGSGRHGVG